MRTRAWWRRCWGGWTATDKTLGVERGAERVWQGVRRFLGFTRLGQVTHYDEVAPARGNETRHVLLSDAAGNEDRHRTT